MAKSIRTSVAIVGGGCAGMSLAGRLAEEKGPDCIVLEAGPYFQSNRTWCFWDNGKARLWDLETDYNWSEWGFREDGEVILHRGSSYRYCCITGDSFYCQQTAKIEAAGNVEVRFNSPVTRINEDGTLFCGDGESTLVRADLIVDTRPVARPHVMLQHFLGWEIVVDDEVFDPTKAMLMDFDVPQHAGVHFFYVLPFSARRALVEATVLSPSVWQQQSYEKALSDYLRDRYQLDVEQVRVVRRESGVLPMARQEEVGSGRRVLLGSVAGAMKVSSGYAFPFIQAQADAMAKDILSGHAVQSAPGRGYMTAWMDDLFVEVLRRAPHKAPSYFRAIFTGTNGDRFARFMMDEATIADRLSIVRSLPSADFVAALLGRLK